MQPRDRLSAKEIQVATLVWQGLTNKDIAGVLHTSEQVVKNYLRTTFDKLGVWTRLELALYVASHGGATWQPKAGASAGGEAWNGPGQNEPGPDLETRVAAASSGAV
ncbi:MAG TPA: helix-turn-helix transcriptional regulator [Terriglobales bacterium]|nr:helix-turn-helix transcriptional regulator [Terriglobales bacterium]